MWGIRLPPVEGVSDSGRSAKGCLTLGLLVWHGGEAVVLICMLGALSFGVLAVLSKAAERRHCDPSSLVVWLFGWAALIMFYRAVAQRTNTSIIWPVIVLAVAFGICGAVAYFAFQSSIARGKVTVGWLMMNLSAGVPAAVSVWLYRERLTLTKEIAFALALIALFCLFQGNRLEMKAAASRKAE